MGMRRLRRWGFALLGGWLCAAGWAAAAAEREATPNGIQISAGRLGNLTVGYPKVTDAAGKEFARSGVAPRGAAAELTFENGGTMTVEARADGAIVYSPQGFPGNFKLEVQTILPFSLAEGGTWQADDGAATPFPIAKPAAPHLYGGHAKTLTIRMAAGDQARFSAPQMSYLQLSDFREWNWTTFGLSVFFDVYPGTDPLTLRVVTGHDAPADPGALLITDPLGQDRKMDWPEKMKSAEELKADLDRDAAYYERFPYPGFDAWGGLPVGARLGLKATGFFEVRKMSLDGSPERWMFVDPAGNPWWQQGICGFFAGDSYTYTAGREDIFAWLPAPDDPEFKTAWFGEGWWGDKAFSFYFANVIRKYGKPYDADEWAERMIGRVKRFGFNSNGAFAGIGPAHRAASFAYCPTLPLDTWALGEQFMLPGVRGFFDPFNPECVARIERLFKEKVAPLAADPMIIGWFLENEQGAEDAARVIPALDGKWHAKRALVDMLRRAYDNDPAAWRRAWNLDAAGFDELNDRSLAVATPAAAEDMKAFVTLFFARYYAVVREAFDRHDPNHLLLGNRWQPGTANNEILIRAAAKYLDVMSLNYYTANGFDANFLARLTGWAGDKPWLFSEWHYCSPADSGLPSGLDVGSQENRARAYRHYVEQAAAMPFVVGQQWFIMVDQARNGRYFEMENGEKGNCGLFSVVDRPWKTLLEAARETNLAVYDIAFGKKAPYRWDDPRFADRSARPKRVVQSPRVKAAPPLNGNRDAWPGVPPETVGANQLATGPDAGDLSAAYRLAWDADNLYLLADVVDPTPKMNTKEGADLWNGDAIELFFGGANPDEPGPLQFGDRQLLLGAREGAPVFVRNAPTERNGVKSAFFPKVDGSGYVLQAAIPWTDLGLAEAPAAGREFLFDLAVGDSEDGALRKRQLMWNGGERGSSERSNWGRLRLGE